MDENPYESINKVIELESDGLKDKLSAKKAEMGVIESEIDKIEEYLDKVGSMGKIGN